MYHVRAKSSSIPHPMLESMSVRSCAVTGSEAVLLFGACLALCRVRAAAGRLPWEAHFAVGENDPIGMHRAMIIRRFHRNRSRLPVHVQNPRSLRPSFIFTHTRVPVLIS